MSKAERISQINQWPEYFIPVPGDEIQTSVESGRFPQSLLDIIHLKDPFSEAVENVAVFACHGDVLDVLPIADIPDSMQSQVQGAQVSKRNRFRFIESLDIDFFSMKGMSQMLDYQGYNDPVGLHTQIFARAKWKLGKLYIEKPMNKGTLTVGRLDLLRGFQESQKEYAMFGKNDASIGQLTVATRLPQFIAEKKGVGIVYPLIDTNTVGDIGNVHILNRVAYDLLLKLKSELTADNSSSFLVSEVIPVPNRQRLETDLQTEGYEIKGDTATKPNGGDASDTGLLGNLRKLFPEWNQKVLALPPQGTAREYERLIVRVLSEVATTQDTEAMAQVLKLISDKMPVKKSVPASLPPATSKKVAQPIPVFAPAVQKKKETSKRSQASKSPRLTRTEIAKKNAKEMALTDFNLPTPVKKVNNQGLENEFDMYTQDEQLITSDSSDWAKDFAPSSSTTSRKKDWSKDF